MSWPHVLSVSRIVAAAPIGALILSGQSRALLIAALLFGAVSLTDLLDGPLARKDRIVAPLGIYLDTTGDKVLVSVVLIAMATIGAVDAWMVMLIVGREFLVSGVRTLAAVQGFVISANLAGKVKTTVTLIAMFILLLAASRAGGGLIGHTGSVSLLKSIGWLGMLMATILTVYSGARYILDARPLFVPIRRAATGTSGDLSAGPAELDRRAPH